MIAYSLGNFLGNGTLNVSGVSGQTAVLRASLRRDGSWVEGKLVPVQLTGGGLPRVDSSRAALSTVRQLSRADFGATPRASRHQARCCHPPGAPAEAVRADLPSGTVTFLFTDVEGSTQAAPRARRGALRGGARRAPSHRSARRALRRAASRWTRRATRSSSRFRRRPARSRPPAIAEALEPGPVRVGSACTRARRS